MGKIRNLKPKILKKNQENWNTGNASKAMSNCCKPGSEKNAQRAAATAVDSMGWNTFFAADVSCYTGWENLARKWY